MVQIIVLAALAATALAVPHAGAGTPNRRHYSPCVVGLYSTAQCCSPNILGVAALDCESPPTVPASAGEFTTICATIGKEPLCCVVPLAGQDVLCTVPGGTSE